MKKRVLYIGIMCWFVLITVAFALCFVDAVAFGYAANGILWLILAAYIGIWVSAVIRKKLIMIIWIPTVILFLMGRPIVQALSGEVWTYYGAEVTTFYLLIMLFSLMGISFPLIKWENKFNLRMLAETCCDGNGHKKNERINNAVNGLSKFKIFTDKRIECAKKFFVNWYNAWAIRKDKIKNNTIFVGIITLGYVITFSCYLATQITEYINMQGKTYLEFYLSHDVAFPWVVSFFSNLSLFFMSIELSVVKKKRTVLIILGLYLLSTIPTLLIGQRNPFILALLFMIAVLYLKNKEHWKVCISKKAAIIVCVCVLVTLLMVVLLMSYSAVIRVGGNVEGGSIFNSILSFVRAQGFTFETVCLGITHRESLRTAENHCYTFSVVADYCKYGQIGNWLFGTSEIPGGNNAERAIMSNDLAHKLSYLVLGEKYLKGEGVGTSYVLEAFLNFGFVGVFLINLLYSVFLTKIDEVFGKNLLLDSVLIYSLLKVFFLGRDSVMAPFSGIVTFHFGLIIIGVYIALYISKKLCLQGRSSSEK